MKKDENFEKQLPENYRQVLHLNAKNATFGLLINIISLIIFIGIAIIAFIPVFKNDRFEPLNVESAYDILIFPFIFCVISLVYLLLHELTHGAFYKALTDEKLTFGISWSCAFCGVPDIYIYRKPALLAAAAPLVIFTVILLPLTVILYFVNTAAYLLCALLFGMHLGGCSGDIFVTLLLLLKYRDNRTLVRDTGPEQFFYVYEESPFDIASNS